MAKDPTETPEPYPGHARDKAQADDPNLPWDAYNALRETLGPVEESKPSGATRPDDPVMDAVDYRARFARNLGRLAVEGDEEVAGAVFHALLGPSDLKKLDFRPADSTTAENLRALGNLFDRMRKHRPHDPDDHGFVAGADGGGIYYGSNMTDKLDARREALAIWGASSLVLVAGAIAANSPEAAFAGPAIGAGVTAAGIAASQAAAAAAHRTAEAVETTSRKDGMAHLDAWHKAQENAYGLYRDAHEAAKETPAEARAKLAAQVAKKER